VRTVQRPHINSIYLPKLSKNAAIADIQTQVLSQSLLMVERTGRSRPIGLI
jgi:hypothetical protein